MHHQVPATPEKQPHSAAHATNMAAAVSVVNDDRGLQVVKQRKDPKGSEHRTCRTLLLLLGVLTAAVLLVQSVGSQLRFHCVREPAKVTLKSKTIPPGKAAASAALPSNASDGYTSQKEHPSCAFFRQGASSVTEEYAW